MKLKFSIKKILPGIFLIGFNIGTGSVTAMSKAGADFGMALLWALAISCIFTFFMIHKFGKMTVVSGYTFLYAIRNFLHPAISIFFVVALGFNVSGSIMGVMGIVADVLHEWSLEWVSGGISSLIWAASLTFLVIVLFLAGNSKFFQKALSVMVSIMAVSFIINAVIMWPSLHDILAGLVPRIPESEPGSTSGFLVAAGMVGTTLAPIVFVARSVLVRDEGWKTDDLKTEKKDAAVSAAMMFIISTSVIISAASTLYIIGVNLEDARDMVQLLKPVAGVFAVNIFVLGITAAGVSSQFPNTFILPWLIHDFKGRKANMRSLPVRVIVIGMALLGLVVPLFNARPVWVMVASQALGAILLPFTVGCIMYLSNSKKLMGEHRASWKDNSVFILLLIFSLIMGVSGLYGLFT